MLENSTIAGNNSLGEGGGIYESYYAQLRTVNTTIAYNATSQEDPSGGGLYVEEYATATLFNTIVRPRQRRDRRRRHRRSGRGHHIDQFERPGRVNETGTVQGWINPIVYGSANPGLGMLGENGGTTATVALLAGSPAINAGSNTLANDYSLTTGQRGTGYPRIVDRTVNIGAFEADGVLTAATGGSTISADTTGQSFTTLTGPSYDWVDGPAGTLTGTIVLNAPAGFAFNTSSHNPPSVSITNVSGTGTNAAGSITAVTATQITFSFTTSSASGTEDMLTWLNVEVQPTAGTPLASGNIDETGTSSLLGGVTQGQGGTNWGTLTEVVGGSPVGDSCEPSSPATAGLAFSPQPVIDRRGPVRQPGDGGQLHRGNRRTAAPAPARFREPRRPPSRAASPPSRTWRKTGPRRSR